ncbi:MAG: hypothetical protein ACPGXL_06165, partial [Chitinophagales bacterium]
KVQGEEEEFIPEQKVVSSKLWLKVNNQLQKAGIYQLHMNPNEPLHFFGFNFNRLESILDYFDLETLKNQFNLPHVTFLKYEDDLTTKIEQLDRGVELWKYFLWAALGFLLLEVLLLRLWKK